MNKVKTNDNLNNYNVNDEDEDKKERERILLLWLLLLFICSFLWRWMQPDGVGGQEDSSSTGTVESSVCGGGRRRQEEAGGGRKREEEGGRRRRIDSIASVVLRQEIFSFILFDGNSGVIVEALGHQLEGQRVLVPGGFLDFSAFILEPDLDLILVQLELVGQVLAPLLVQVAVLAKFAFETGQLLRGEGRPRALLLAAAAATAAAGPAGFAPAAPAVSTAAAAAAAASVLLDASASRSYNK